jgi:hypothetical protein
VAGTPFSAQAALEFTQTLADGTRVQRSSGAAVYRDGQGRTRRELSGTGFGPLFGDPRGAAAKVLVVIGDPVAGVTYVIDDEARTAVRRAFPRRVRAPDARPGGSGPDAGGDSGSRSRADRPRGPGTTTVEPLGTRSVDGIEVEGSRRVTTIPAGAIGNDQPIVGVSERWYSNELQVLMSSRHADPRFGETTYQLTNIVRGEPSPDLFTVPPGYTVTEAPSRRGPRRRDTQMRPPR